MPKGIAPGIEKIAELTAKKSGLSLEKVKGMKSKGKAAPSFLKRRSKLFGKVVILLLLFSPSIFAQSPINSKDTVLKTFDSEQITVAAVAVGFTASKINPTVTDAVGATTRARLATCYNNTAEIRVLSTGTAPTSTVGIIVSSGTTFYIWGYDDVSNFKAIRTTGVSAVLDCQYSRLP